MVNAPKHPGKISLKLRGRLKRNINAIKIIYESYG